MKNSNMLTSGEFARLVGTTKDTLFHYDRIGLLKPEGRQEGNNYRYYTLAQLDIFDIIDTLKELDMPLTEIRNYLGLRTPYSLMELFEREDKILNEKIRHLRQARQWMRMKKDMIQQALSIDTGCIELRTLPRMYCAVTYISTDVEQELASAVTKLLSICKRYNVPRNYDIGYRQDTRSLRNGIYNAYCAGYIPIPQPIKKVPCEEHPAGTYLVGYHCGDWREIGDTYKKIISYADEQRLELEDLCREDSLLDGLSQMSEDDYLTQISWKCHPKP